MKKTFFSLLPTFFLAMHFFSTDCALANQIEFENQQQNFSDDKIYVNSDCIAFDQDKIYILLNDELLAVSSIHSDTSGIYFYEVKGWPVPMYWPCVDDHMNPRSAYPTCLFCGKGPKES